MVIILALYHKIEIFFSTQTPSLITKNKRKSLMSKTYSCSGCGKKDHTIKACNWIGVVLHGFINMTHPDEAMGTLNCITYGGLAELALRLDIPSQWLNKRVNRYEILDILRQRWCQIRLCLYDTLERELNELKSQIEETERMRSLGFCV